MAVALQRYHHHQQASDVMGYAMGEESMYAQDQALAQASAPASTAGDENTGAMPDSSIPLGYRQNAPKTDQQDAAAEHAKQPAQQLTSEEVIELTAFARGKAKIEEQIALLEEIKEIDAFEGFESMEGGSAAIAKAEEVCPYTREDVEQWQQAREAMERDADAFQAHDMSKLRSLATNLVELALKTLYSLDKLLILLRSRQSYLDVLAVRAEWEQRRSISWAQYYALQREVHELVRTKAQWLGHAEVAEHTFREGSQGSINDPSTDDTSLLASSSSTDVIKKTSSALTGHSPQKTSSKAKRSLTASLALGEVLQLEIAKMRSKIALWSDTAVAAAGRAMDAIIDHCQVPDALLDEQDRLENFVEEMKQKLNFLLALGEQWRRSDHLLGKLRELNRNARMLVMSMEEAETPDMQQVHLMEQKCATLREALVAICGDNATKFLDDSTQSSRTLTFLPSLAPPLALHPSFPTQREANDEVMQFLQRELTAAAKKTRQACRDVQQCAEAQRALDVFDARIAPLRALTARCEAVRTRIAALQMSLSEAAATADLSDVWKDVPGWQHDVVSCQSQVTEMRTAGAKAVQELSSQRALCVECGLSSTWLAKREDGCERELETALQKLDAELRDVSSLCVQAAAIDSGVSVSREISETLGTVCDRFDHLAHQPLDLPASSQAMSLRSRLLHELQQELDTGNRARNARLRVQTEVISSQLEAPAHAVTTRLQTLDDALKQASQRLRWEEARLRQASQVGELNDKAEERQQEAIQVLARLEIGAPEAHSYSADVDCICLDLASFVSGIASKTDIVGKAPALPAVANHANVVPPDPDYLARRFLNDICAKLTALRVRIMEKHAAMSAVTPEGTAPPPHRTDARDTSSSIPPDASVVRGDQLANEKPSIAAGNRLPALVDKGLSPLRVSASNTPSKLSSSTRAAKSAAPESEKVAALLDNLHRDPRLAVKSDIPSIEDAAEADHYKAWQASVSQLSSRKRSSSAVKQRFSGTNQHRPSRPMNMLRRWKRCAPLTRPPRTL
ncbi:hypothetical protein K437DRAFT_262155 [Tilletiaria anomala UBC 951]|uniref:Uncharacterized protein n=1 Tax=Tilletiaria anomala (strain ATCC 24038 / CBS 436.72 / UBC 951) TaxID=1037660 RepID=A0A066WDP6_TILAU|nr:uncharacterized protein K437DRAFT_262155 [Tilletiaria anomala UBC 951]KDN48865.1 hypothetical protein K437DRAFT_262155 [Tilletiaria anomala UBC 951]